MKNFFCLDCHHSWISLQDEICPECSSGDVEIETVEDWTDGHFEGDMPLMYDTTDHDD